MKHGNGLGAEALRAVLDTIQAVADRRLGKDRRLQLDADEEFPADLVAEMLGPDVGLHLVYLPEVDGGLDGGVRDVFQVSEKLGRIDLGVSTALLAIVLGADPIFVGGTRAQRSRWLGRIAGEGLVVAYGVTEPAAGSNVAALQTTAEPILGDDGEITAYRLNGTKQFISNGGVAALYTVLARAPGGPSFFVIERGTPGLSAGPPEQKLGIRASNTTAVFLEDVIVPADQLLGLEEGKGLEHANEVFGYTRLQVAAFGLGAGEEALGRAVAYSREREQFGSLLCHKQGFTHKLLVPHAVRLQAARAYGEEVADRMDGDEPGLQVEGSVAKYFATEAGKAAADAAIQAHGGYGYTREYEVEKIWRDVRITTIYEGTSEIQQNIIGAFRWRSVVRSKGGFYRDMADSLRELGAAGEAVGAPRAAAAADAMAETVLAAHRARLPRQQHVLFELARLMAEVETAVALCRKAARPGAAPSWLEAASRLHADTAAREVAFSGLGLLQGSGKLDAETVAAWRGAVDFDGLVAGDPDHLDDMDRIAERLTADD